MKRPKRAKALKLPEPPAKACPRGVLKSYDRARALQIVLFCVVAERPVTDVQQIGCLGAHSIRSFEGALQVAAFGLGDFFLEVDPFYREGRRAIWQRRISRISRDSVW